MYLLGYIPAHNKIYLVDKDVNVYAYALSLAVVEYQTAVLRGDMEAASELLADFPVAGVVLNRSTDASQKYGYGYGYGGPVGLEALANAILGSAMGGGPNAIKRIISKVSLICLVVQLTAACAIFRLN